MTGTAKVADEVHGKPQKFDLEERTARFGESVIAFAKKIPRNPVTVSLISQVVRSGTSIGANYCEADDAVSKKDFRNKIGIAKKRHARPSIGCGRSVELNRT